MSPYSPCYRRRGLVRKSPSFGGRAFLQFNKVRFGQIKGQISPYGNFSPRKPRINPSNGGIGVLCRWLRLLSFFDLAFGENPVRIGHIGRIGKLGLTMSIGATKDR